MEKNKIKEKDKIKEKRMMPRGQRNSLLMVSVLGLLVAGFGIYRILSPTAIESDEALYNYYMAVSSDYKVYLKPNKLYPQTYLEENFVYPKSLFDKLAINFRADFIGSAEEASEITADYSIAVKVRGFQTKNDEKKIVYEHSFPLRSESGLSFDQKAEITESVSLLLSEYENFANEANEILMASPSNEAEVAFSGHFKVENRYGEKEEAFDYRFPLPLGQNLFTIDKPSQIDQNGAITQKDVQTLHTGRYWLVLPVGAIILFLALAVHVVFATRLPEGEELDRLEFKKILRKYGSRIVRVDKSAHIKETAHLQIHDMESLVKISDQCNTPIFYFIGEGNLPQKNCLFIPQEEMAYIYYIQPALQSHKEHLLPRG